MISRSEIMRRVRSSNTGPERRVRAAMKRLNIRISKLHLFGTPDFVLPTRGAVLFVHGCFWHRHSCVRGRSHPTENRNFWAEKFRRNIRRDRRVTRRLRADGWRVLTVWECDTHDEQALDRLLLRKLRSKRRGLMTGRGSTQASLREGSRQRRK
ncbi:MAG: DNA mismatch endonuclease Vsr [Phycisphaerales bacterium]